MKTMLFIIFLCIFLLIANVSYADQFQVVDNKSGFYVAYSPCNLNGKLIGYTDKYGRITINLKNGTYSFEITFRNKLTNINLTINGSSNLKIIKID
jgi:hypothetical protein